MEKRFEYEADDPVSIKLSAELFELISQPFNDWMVMQMTVKSTGRDATLAACLVFSTLLSLLSDHTAAPGAEVVYAESVGKAITQQMLMMQGMPNAPAPDGEPDASTH